MKKILQDFFGRKLVKFLEQLSEQLVRFLEQNPDDKNPLLNADFFVVFHTVKGGTVRRF